MNSQEKKISALKRQIEVLQKEAKENLKEFDGIVGTKEYLEEELAEAERQIEALNRELLKHKQIIKSLTIALNDMGLLL